MDMQIISLTLDGLMYIWSNLKRYKNIDFQPIFLGKFSHHTYITRDKKLEGAKGTKEFFWKKWAQATTLYNNINLNTN